MCLTRPPRCGRAAGGDGGKLAQMLGRPTRPSGVVHLLRFCFVVYSVFFCRPLFLFFLPLLGLRPLLLPFLSTRLPSFLFSLCYSFRPFVLFVCFAVFFFSPSSSSWFSCSVCFHFFFWSSFFFSSSFGFFFLPSSSSSCYLFLFVCAFLSSSGLFLLFFFFFCVFCVFPCLFSYVYPISTLPEHLHSTSLSYAETTLNSRKLVSFPLIAHYLSAGPPLPPHPPSPGDPATPTLNHHS